MGKGGKHLKSALLSQQSRLKAKQKLSSAAQVLEQKTKKNGKQPATSSSKKNAKAKRTDPAARKPTIPFKPTDTILLIGEGNFSFARALVVDAPGDLQFLPPSNITATAYDTEGQCYEKYPDARDIVAQLRERGVRVLFGVDATRLDKIAGLKGRRWDHIVWNFPHAGKGISDQDRNILSNQLLLLGFLDSASKMLSRGPIPAISSRKRKETSEDDADEEGDSGQQEERQSRGTVLVTLRNVAPYTQWDLPRLAKNPPPPQSASASSHPCYVLLRSFQFHRDIWKGYEHRMTKGERAHGTGKTGEGGEDRTWEFYLRGPNSLA